MIKNFKKSILRENGLFSKWINGDLTFISNIDGEKDVRKVLYNACENKEHAGDHTNFKEFRFLSWKDNRYVAGVTIHDDMWLFEVKDFNNEGVYLKRIDLEFVMSSDDSVRFLNDRLLQIDIRGNRYGYYPVILDIKTRKVLFKANYTARVEKVNRKGENLLIYIACNTIDRTDKLLIIKNNKISKTIEDIRRGGFIRMHVEDNVVFKIQRYDGARSVMYFDSKKAKFKELFSYDNDVDNLFSNTSLWSKDDTWYVFNKHSLKSSVIEHCSGKGAILEPIKGAHIELCIGGEYSLMDYDGNLVDTSIKANSFFEYSSHMTKLKEDLLGYTKTDGSVYMVDRKNYIYEVPKESVSEIEQFANEMLIYERCVDGTSIDVTAIKEMIEYVDKEEVIDELEYYMEDSSYGGKGVEPVHLDRYLASRYFVYPLTKGSYDKGKSSIMALPNKGKISLYEMIDGKLNAMLPTDKLNVALSTDKLNVSLSNDALHVVLPSEDDVVTFDYFVPATYCNKELIFLFNTNKELYKSEGIVEISKIEDSITVCFAVLIDGDSYEVFNVYGPSLEQELVDMLNDRKDFLEEKLNDMEEFNN